MFTSAARSAVRSVVVVLARRGVAADAPASLGFKPGSVAFVTGAASGIGRATAIAFGQQGVKVVVSDVNAAGGAETVELVRNAGSDAAFVKVDVTNDADCAAGVQFAVRQFGGLDYAVNNAGWESQFHPVHEMPLDVFDRTLQINLRGVFSCMRHEIPVLLRRGEGSAIVNVASVAGLTGFAGAAAYTASKFGLNGMTRTAALDYAKSGLRINSVCPGVIQTPMIDRALDRASLQQIVAVKQPIGRTGRPEEVAAMIVFLCSPHASLITGGVYAVDGGFVA